MRIRWPGARRAGGATRLDRIFGTAPGAYGSGVEDLFGRDVDRETIGAAYLAAASHSYGGAAGDGTAAPGAFAQRVGSADLLVHAGDDPPAISSKAPKMRRLSAALRRRPSCSAAPPIWSCST